MPYVTRKIFHVFIFDLSKLSKATKWRPWIISNKWDSVLLRKQWQFRRYIIQKNLTDECRDIKVEVEMTIFWRKYFSITIKTKTTADTLIINYFMILWYYQLLEQINTNTWKNKANGSCIKGKYYLNQIDLAYEKMFMVQNLGKSTCFNVFWHYKLFMKNHLQMLKMIKNYACYIKPII